MQMRMMLEVLTPGVKHRKEADCGAQMLGVGGDGLQCSCRGLAQNAVDHLLILVGKGGDLRRDGEHDMKVGGSPGARIDGLRATGLAPDTDIWDNADRG